MIRSATSIRQLKVPVLLAVFLLGRVAASEGGSATWSFKPGSSNWTTPNNWVPTVVPNGPGDIATFPLSRTLLVTLATPVEVDSVVFDSTVKNPYSLYVPGLSLSGAGVINNSATMSAFWTYSNPNGGFNGTIQFENNATAGSNLTYNCTGVADGSSDPAGKVVFFDQSTAGSCAYVTYAGSGTIEFHGSSSAATAAITNNGGLGSATADLSYGGHILFYDNSTAGAASFDNRNSYGLDGNANMHFGGSIEFYGSSVAGSAVITNSAALQQFNGPALTHFYDSASAGASSITNNGAIAAVGSPGTTFFHLNSTAATATLIAANGTNGGTGGSVQFLDDSTGGGARLEVFGNGTLDISGHNSPGVTIGSLEGDGIVALGARNLTVGGSGLRTTFAGSIQDGGIHGGTHGALTKTGSATLTLTGAYTYTGTTLVSGGILDVTGTLQGPLSVASASRTASSVSPGEGTIGSLTVKQGTTFKRGGNYNCELDSDSGQSDQLTSKGVQIAAGSQIVLRDLGSSTFIPGTTITVLNNTSTAPIKGTFSNLLDGGVLTLNGTNFQANYEGGSGNDLTLTVVP